MNVRVEVDVRQRIALLVQATSLGRLGYNLKGVFEGTPTTPPIPQKSLQIHTILRIIRVKRYSGIPRRTAYAIVTIL